MAKTQQRQRVPQETNVMEESDLAQDEGSSVTTEREAHVGEKWWRCV